MIGPDTSRCDSTMAISSELSVTTSGGETASALASPQAATIEVVKRGTRTAARAADMKVLDAEVIGGLGAKDMVLEVA
jgi:hypothetical protein